MSNKSIAMLLIIAGALLLLVFLTADILGLGGDPNAFGWKQITGSAAGLIILLVGLWLRSKGKNTSRITRGEVKF
jgi:hypothetical protein